MRWGVTVLILSLVPISESVSLASIPAEIEALFQRLRGENTELSIAKNSVSSHEQSLTMVESLLYPSLSLVGVASRSKPIDLQGTPQTVSAPSTSGGATSTAGGGGTSIPPTASASNPQAGALSLPSSFVQDTSGWSIQLSSTYYLFTRFAVSNAIESTRMSAESSKIRMTSAELSKQSELLQNLLTWQWLDQLSGPIHDAEHLATLMKKHSTEKASLLFTEEDSTVQEERLAELEYNVAKVREGKALVEAVLRDLIPSLTVPEVKRVPKFAVDYLLPDLPEIAERYRAQSLDLQIDQNDLAIAEGDQKTMEWNQSWVPNLLISGGVTRSSPSEGVPSNSWSTQILASFNLFDGFYSSARKRQSGIAVAQANAKMDLNTSKTLILLQGLRSQALLAQSEHHLKAIKARREFLKLEDVKRKKDEGYATELECSLANLMYVKAQVGALDALKDYQSAGLSLAVRLNDWDRVKIYETRN